MDYDPYIEARSDILLASVGCWTCVKLLDLPTVMHGFFCPGKKKMIHKLTSSQAHIAKLAMTQGWFFVVVLLPVCFGPVTEASINSVAVGQASDSNSSVQCVNDACFPNLDCALCGLGKNHE